MFRTLPKWARLVLACIVCLALLIGLGLLIDWLT